MAKFEHNNVGIKAIAAAVPGNTVINEELTEFFSKKEAEAIVAKTGINQRRIAENGICASDLCFAAAEKLISDNDINRDEIDLLIFVSQTPDYRMPATAFLLQNRLGLSKHTVVFDINLGCSGFVHGLFVIYGLMHNNAFRKALLLNGETRSRVYNFKDRPVAYLFGDAGSATLIQNDSSFGKSYFSINSDGANADLIMIPGGGYRHPSSEETIKEKVVDEHGNIRSDENGFMRGDDVFSWLLKNVPKDIKSILDYSQSPKDIIDYFVFHQANSFMNGFLAKKLKLPNEKVPSSISKFGNTSGVSIPLTVVSELKHKINPSTKLLLSGFGVGMTWTSAIINAKSFSISDLVEI